MLTPQDILKLPYERILLPEDEGGYSAYIGEFEGCAADGETADEALSNLNEAALAWVLAEQEAGRNIPQPLSLQEFSGKILLRLPKTVHQRLARQANKEEVSLNQYIVQKLSADVRQDELVDSLITSIKRGLAANWVRGDFGPLSTVQTSSKVFKLSAAAKSKWVVAKGFGMVNEGVHVHE